MIDADSGERAKSAAMVSAEREHKRLVRNAKQRQMYGPTHRRRRVQFARRIERGEVLICPRCGLPIGPDQKWDLATTTGTLASNGPNTAPATAPPRTGC